MDRIYSKLNEKRHIFPVHTLLYTLPGIPSIYYGSEFGIEGRKEGGNDDPLRPEVDLETLKNQNMNTELTQWIRHLGQIKAQNKELSFGKYRELL